MRYSARIYNFRRLLSNLTIWPLLAFVLSTNLNAAPFGLEQQVVPTTPELGANFGTSVAIDGDTAVVGAFNEDKADATVGEYGAVYVYERQGDNSWNQVAKFIAKTIGGADVQKNEQFGWSVAIKNELIVVGAPQTDFAGPIIQSGGRAFVFQKSVGTWSTTPIAVLLQNDPANAADNELNGSQFGFTVDVANPTGNEYNVIIGAWGAPKDIDPVTELAPVPAVTNVGAVFLYNFPDITVDATVTPNVLRATAIAATAKLTNIEGLGGSSSPEALGKDGDSLANALAISADGNTVVAGAANTEVINQVLIGNDAGTVYVWQKPVGGWQDWDHLGDGDGPGIGFDPMPVTRELSFNALSALDNTGLKLGDRFGNSVDINDDASVIVAGARGFDEDVLLDPGSAIGAILLFEQANSDWSGAGLRLADRVLIDKPDAPTERQERDRVGTSVSIAPDDSVIVAGLNDFLAGHSGRPERVLVWNRPGATWAAISADLEADQSIIATDFAFDCARNLDTNDQSCDLFGASISNTVDTDGTRIIVGAAGHNVNNVRTQPREESGLAYVFSDISGSGNTAPVATPDPSITTNEDTPTGTITLTGTDLIDGDPLDFTVFTTPANGTLTGDPSTIDLVYTPDTDFNGVDTFTFKAHDGTAFSAEATITITVSAAPDLPLATPQSVVTSEDVAIGITLAGTDPDGDAITGFPNVTNPASGVLSGTEPNLTYTPNIGFTGSDSFTFKVSNNGGADVSVLAATVDIIVNDVPVVDPAQSFPVAENSVATTAVGTVAKTDTIFEATAGYTFSIISGNASGFFDIDAATGAITVAVGALLDAETTDTYLLAVRLNDGYVDSAIDEIVTINVTDVNEFAPVITTPNPNPLAFDLSDSTIIGASIQTMVVTDGDADPNIVFSLQDDFTGTFAIDASGNITVEGPLDAGTTPSYVLKADASDGVTTVTATYNITVVSTPAAINQNVIATEDIAIEITLVGNDSDGLPDPLTYTIVAAPDSAKGSLGLINNVNKVTFTPVSNFNGQATFTFKVNDGAQDSNTATVTINVAAVDDPPTADDQTLATDEDTSVVITLTGNDTEGSALTYSIATQPDAAKGSLGTVSGDTVTFTPAADVNGEVTFTFIVTADGVDSAPATVTINVTSVANDNAPIAEDQAVKTDEDTSVVITLSGDDSDGDTLTFSIVAQPDAAKGSLGTLTDDKVTFTPVADFTGTVTFTFKITANGVDSNTATITITVNSSGGGGGSLSAFFLMALLLLGVAAMLRRWRPAYN